MPKKTKTTDQFIDQSKQRFPNRFTYFKTIYGINQYIPVTITCIQHGDFENKPSLHLYPGSNGGCKLCANLIRGAYHKLDTNQFIKNAKIVHKDKYDYSMVDYKNTHTKVSIICPDHGVFKQTPASHTSQGNGCNICSYKDYQGGFNHKRFTNRPEIKTIPAILYIIKTGIQDDPFIKIGITQKPISVRMNRARLPWNYEEVCSWEGLTYNLFLIEQQLKRTFKSHKHIPEVKFDGYTECFKYTILSKLVLETEKLLQL